MVLHLLGSRPRPTRRRLTPLLCALLALGLTAGLTAATVPSSTAAAGPATRATTPPASNPLDDASWPIYRGHAEGAYAAWNRSSGTTKALLAKIALQPRVMWVTNGSESPASIEASTRIKIADFHHDSPYGYAQLAVFGLYPRGEARRKEAFTAAMQAQYKRWIGAVSRAIGQSRVIMILEPDLAVALTGSRPSVRFALAAYASRVFRANNKNTVVYLDGSSADWLSVPRAVSMLAHSGIRNVRGIALGATHYDSLGSNVMYGATLVRQLAKSGYRGKRVVIDTADNGAPLTHRQYYQRFPHGQFDNANVCHSRTERLCETLGIPPTTNVASTRWGMSTRVRNTAATYVDAFLWYGRPWLDHQASPFDLDRALAVASSTHWQ